MKVTGSGKTYLACLASYRMLNYTSTKRVLFLVDRNNLARQTESEFNLFDRTEKQRALSDLYKIHRLRKEDDIKGDIVISTIQKLFAVLTGQTLTDDNEDAEDENTKRVEEKELEEVVQLGSDLKLPSDYFQLIVVDECHRSIYGKWKAVLDYFSGAKVLGLTATPTPEAYSYFNNNVIEKYTYDDSVVDGVNVPARVYRIATEVTEHGGTIEAGTEIVEIPKRKSEATTYAVANTIEYAPVQLDRSVINRNQMKTVLEAYKNALYTELYPEREEFWEYIPKTLIFAKDDNHATEIVNVAKEVFGSEFEDGEVPENYVQKITYSSGDSNALIRDFRTEKDFRIAVTVTLVATGTDVRPLEVVLFMKDVQSDVLYTQMKGRGCRVIKEDKLKEVTPNAHTKECYYIVDAVGVSPDTDELLYAGFSKESARDYIDNFEKFLLENKDSIEALRIIYNSEDVLITHTMLCELQERLLAESKQYGIYQIWKNYKLLDTEGSVEELDIKSNVNMLTNLIQIVRFAYRKNTKLTSLLNGYAQRFSLYCGQAQRVLTEEQKEIMKLIAEYILNEGAISIAELNAVDTDLWRKGVMNFGIPSLTIEMQTLSKFILKVA